MRVFRQFSIILATVILLASCGGKVKTPTHRNFPPPPQVPSVVTDPQEMAGYVATHFWDAFLTGTYPCDSSLVNGVPADDVESAVGRFVTILETVCERPAAIKAMDVFFQKVNDFQAKNPSSNVYGYFMRMVGKYLYDPNSPVRDEDLYLPYIKGLVNSDLTPEDMKPAYSRDVQMCSLNQVGTQAADIKFTSREGRVLTLYGIKSDNVLLLFSNPGCPNCEEVISALTGNECFNEAISAGKLAVVNLYIDLEVDKWMALASEYPKAWTNGYDQDYTIRKDLTYNVRAIPSLYLLDKDKKVIMKDAPIEKVLPYLENI